MKQTIRIIGGLYRGKKIQFPEVEGLRPTPDRVRETLFNWLMNDIRQSHCLDAFAGSGALGLEAFSRGAGEVIFIEHSQAAHANLKKIIALFNSPNLKLNKADTLTYLRKSTQQFDIIFLDPPFAQNIIPECLDIIAHNGLISRGGLVYFEAPNEINFEPGVWQQIKLKKSGQVIYGLFKKL